MMDNLDLPPRELQTQIKGYSTKPPALPFQSAEITKDKRMTEELSRIKAVNKARQIEKHSVLEWILDK